MPKTDGGASWSAAMIAVATIACGAPPTPTPSTPPGRATEATETAEQRIVQILGEERRRVGVVNLVSDSGLRATAIEHARDRAVAGHPIPPRAFADPTSYVRRWTSKGALAHAQSTTVEDAVAQMLANPAMRAALLEPLYTHIGVGVAFERQDGQSHTIHASVVVARRPAPDEARQSNSSTFDAIQRLREGQGLGALRIDPILAAAAQAGLEARFAGNPPSSARAHAAARASTDRTELTGYVCTSYAELLERLQLAQVAFVLQPKATSIGLATRILEAAEGPRLSLFLVITGPDLAAGDCR